MLTTESILGTVIAPRLIADIRTSQKNRKLYASGRSADSLSFTVKRNGSLITLTITGASYWRYQANGRRANRKKGRPSTWFVNVIREWIQVKNLSIPLRAAGAIAYNIVNQGIPSPNRFNDGKVLSEPLNSKRIAGLLKVELKAHELQSVRSKLFAA